MCAQLQFPSLHYARSVGDEERHLIRNLAGDKTPHPFLLFLPSDFPPILLYCFCECWAVFDCLNPFSAPAVLFVQQAVTIRSVVHPTPVAVLAYLPYSLYVCLFMHPPGHLPSVRLFVCLCECPISRCLFKRESALPQLLSQCCADCL